MVSRFKDIASASGKFVQKQFGDGWINVIYFYKSDFVKLNSTFFNW
jgi:hypothetical protein